jgi:hypothetical protein
MNDDRAFQRATREWLEEGSDRTPPAAVDAVLLAVRTTSQERDLRVPWRTPFMSTPLRAAAGIAIVAVLGIAIISFVGRGSNVGGGPTPGPTASATPSPAPVGTVAPTVLGPLDTAAWTTYTSTRYGFTIGHPAGWSTVASNHAWAFPADATDFPPKAGETFHSPPDDVAVSAWSVAITPGTTLASWLQTYCAVAESNTPCSALGGNTISISMDGHAGLLVRFKDDTQAFSLIGNQLYVVACWRPEAEASVAPYGGATRLLEGYLATMHLLQVPPPTAAPTVRSS